MVVPAGLDRFDVADDPSRPSPSPSRWPNSTYFRWFPVGSPRTHLHRDLARSPGDICTAATSLCTGAGLASATSALGMGGKWAHFYHIC
jgi:hypothetical protein